MPRTARLSLQLLAGVLVCAAALHAAQGPVPVPPIPETERFIEGTGLRVRLTMRSTSLAAFEDPGFMAIFENVGATPLHLNPRVASDVRIYDDSGTLVEPHFVAIVNRFRIIVTSDDLRRIPPGGAWQVALSPVYQLVPGRSDSESRYDDVLVEVLCAAVPRNAALAQDF